MSAMLAIGNGGSKGIADMTPQEWQAYLDKNNLGNSRLQQLNTSNQTYLNSLTPTSASSASGLSGSAGSSSSLFGNLSTYTDQAKDLANFNLGLNKDQETFDSGLRETEAQNNYGRNYKLADQQITGQKDITNIQQDATTDRLQRQLTSQQTMQKSGFDQQNLYRAQSAALALRGLR